MDWSLFGCARRGHVTSAPDEPDLRERLMAPTAGGRPDSPPRSYWPGINHYKVSRQRGRRAVSGFLPASDLHIPLEAVPGGDLRVAAGVELFN